MELIWKSIIINKTRFRTDCVVDSFILTKNSALAVHIAMRVLVAESHIVVVFVTEIFYMCNDKYDSLISLELKHFKCLF